VDDRQSFIDATPTKGVIIVEYYWQDGRKTPWPGGGHGKPAGAHASMIYFRRIRAADECWCGSRRRFSRCHRREDDWTYVTLDPDQAAYSPVVLLERTSANVNLAYLCNVLRQEPGLLQIERSDSLEEWGVPAEPFMSNENGQLILGTIGISRNQVHIETNSERRFAHLLSRFEGLIGPADGEGSTWRSEPQKAFALNYSPYRRMRARR
jgi:SEC-C motif